MPATATAGTASVITETAGTVPVPDRIAALCQTPASLWTADDLSWYVTSEIRQLHGHQLPRAGEGKMVPAFFERFGADGVRIARHVFEARRGMWKGAPVTLGRFSASNDDFFARPILDELPAS